MNICANEKCRKPFEIKRGHFQRFCCRSCKQRTNRLELIDKRKRGISIQKRVKKWTCTKCGKEIASRSKTRMCRTCWAASTNQEVDSEVFQAVIEFKAANDGLSPKCVEIAKMLYRDSNTVARSMGRLENAGRIKRVWSSRNRAQIIVPGGKWVYEG